MTFCDTIAGIEVRFGRTEPEPRTDGWTDGQTDVEVKIVRFTFPNKTVEIYK